MRVIVEGGYASGDADLTLYVELTRTGGSGQLKLLPSTPLERIGGSTADGRWAGVVWVPSTANGTFKVTGVSTGSYGPGRAGGPDPTAFDGPSLSVNGTHQPKITAVTTPKVVPIGKPFSIRWSVTDSTTGKPYGTKLRADLSGDNGCIGDGAVETLRTDANGYLTRSYPATRAPRLNCLLLPGNPVATASLGFFVKRSTGVSAAPAATSARVGAAVPVNGSVAGLPSGCTVNLQRLSGATQWRTVGTAGVRPSGRFTLTARPAAKGVGTYRAELRVCRNFVVATSKTFTVRGV